MIGTAAALVRALKYGGWRELAGEMAERMAKVRFPVAARAEICAALPVPLSPVRLRERGYNQAELLAQALADRGGWPVLGRVLVRVRHTQRQAQLTPRDRGRNVADAFAVPPERRVEIADKHLLLVDDVLTTGATAGDCVRALCRAGARAVSVLTFARARRELPQPPARALSGDRRQP